jgi:predicted porin
VYGGTYAIGPVKLGLHESRVRWERVDGSGDVKSRVDALSAGWNVTSKIDLNAGYAFGKVTTSGTDAFKPKAWDLIGLYNFSKRTNVYLAYSETKYDSQVSGIPTVKQQQYGIGIRHNF